MISSRMQGDGIDTALLEFKVYYDWKRIALVYSKMMMVIHTGFKIKLHRHVKSLSIIISSLA